MANVRGSGAKKRSRGYNIEGSKYSFDIVDDKIVGIKKADDNGQFGNSLVNEYLNPRLSTFGDIAASSEALNAYNIAKHGFKGLKLQKKLQMLFLIQKMPNMNM